MCIHLFGQFQYIYDIPFLNASLMMQSLISFFMPDVYFSFKFLVLDGNRCIFGCIENLQNTLPLGCGVFQSELAKLTQVSIVWFLDDLKN